MKIHWKEILTATTVGGITCTCVCEGIIAASTAYKVLSTFRASILDHDTDNVMTKKLI